jgi:hypothetical protein
MIFDVQSPVMRKKAIDRFKYLLDKKAKIEILEKSKKRTYSQNNYLHLILGLFALEYGETLDFVKQTIFKEWVNKGIFQYEFTNYKTGEFRTGLKSTTKLTTAELSVAIERFRNYSVENLSLYLPEPKDITHLEEIQNELEKHYNKIYL